MKKLIALLLVLTLPLSFIACSNDETSSGEDTSNQEQTTSTEADKSNTNDTTNSTEADESNTNDTTKAPENFEETLDFNKDTTIEETVIYNKDGLKVTAKSLKHCSEIDDDMLFCYSALEKISKQHGYMLFSIEVENTSDEEIVCNFTEKISINGFEISTSDPEYMASFAQFGNLHAFIFDSQGKDLSKDNIYLSPGEWNRIDYYLDCVTLMSLRIFEIAEIKPTGAKMGGYHNGERNGTIDCQKVKTSAFQSHNNSATHSEALMAKAFEAKGRELVYFSDFSSGMYYNYAEDEGYGSVTVLSAALIEGGTGDADNPKDHAIIWIENTGNVDLYINNGFLSNMGLPLCVGEKGILFAPISFSPQQSDPVYISCTKTTDPYNQVSGSYEPPLISFNLLINLSDTANGSNAKGIEVYKNGSERILASPTTSVTPTGIHNFVIYFWHESEHPFSHNLDIESLKSEVVNGNWFDEENAADGFSYEVTIIYKNKYVRLYKYRFLLNYPNYENKTRTIVPVFVLGNDSFSVPFPVANAKHIEEELRFYQPMIDLFTK